MAEGYRRDSVGFFLNGKLQLEITTAWKLFGIFRFKKWINLWKSGLCERWHRIWWWLHDFCVVQRIKWILHQSFNFHFGMEWRKSPQWNGIFFKYVFFAVSNIWRKKIEHPFQGSYWSANFEFSKVIHSLTFFLWSVHMFFRSLDISFRFVCTMLEQSKLARLCSGR